MNMVRCGLGEGVKTYECVCEYVYRLVCVVMSGCGCGFGCEWGMCMGVVLRVVWMCEWCVSV